MTAIAIAAIVVAVFSALLGLLWLLTRNPSRDRQLAAAVATVKRQGTLIERLHREALESADVDPVAQVFVDYITQAGLAPARLNRKER